VAVSGPVVVVFGNAGEDDVGLVIEPIVILDEVVVLVPPR